jgi:UV DNA damage endonuclease
MLRLGLCCVFVDQPIKFSTTQATPLARLDRPAQLAKLDRLCLNNADALLAALKYCADHDIGCFRINSQILPLKTHPQLGYDLAELPRGQEIIDRFQTCGEFARAHQVRTCFHPDQFVVLNSRRPEVVSASLRELEYQAQVARWVGADVINIHAGGAFGDKGAALADFASALDRLSDDARSRLTVENDDTTFTPADLLPVCRATGVPLVYDVHHHRCLRDALSVEAATDAACATWNREPMFHISSPLEGWNRPKPQRHHDYIAIDDFPDCWRDLDVTVEVEAKAKERAVARLAADLLATRQPPAKPRRAPRRTVKDR